MARCDSFMSNTRSFIQPPQSNNPTFANVALGNQVHGQENVLQPVYPSPSSGPTHDKVTYLHRTCAECFTRFSTNSNLEQHASSAGHTAFSCTCGAQFSRAYTLTRHINSMIGLGYPCELCDDKAFPRLDKLGDHLRRFHRLGTKAFDQYKGGSSPPSSASSPISASLPPQTLALGQAYPGAPGVEPMMSFSGFLPVSGNILGGSSAGCSVTSGNSTAADNWWCSQPGHAVAYQS